MKPFFNCPWIILRRIIEIVINMSNAARDAAIVLLSDVEDNNLAANTVVPTGSGPNGDFLERDLLKLNRRAMRVSLKLLPFDAILRIYPNTDADPVQLENVKESNYVQFSHKPTNQPTWFLCQRRVCYIRGY